MGNDLNILIHGHKMDAIIYSEIIYKLSKLHFTYKSITYLESIVGLINNLVTEECYIKTMNLIQKEIHKAYFKEDYEFLFNIKQIENYLDLIEWN